MSANAPIEQAAALLRAGGLVAFPTETVYGLGANAECVAAVRRVFEVKGRPVNHPLIVHIADVAELERWVAEVPDLARALARSFWPGPLTLVLRRGQRLPLEVTGGLETVGIRVPAHPVALELLRAFGGAVAAPSANRFGRVSPTRPEHVREDLGSLVDVIVDGGPCTVGIESTIVDCSGEQPAILRPGGVSREAIEAALGMAVPVATGGPVKAPGQLASHYAPRAQVLLVAPEAIAEQARELGAKGLRVGIITTEPLAVPSAGSVVVSGSDVELAAELYSALREFDRVGCDLVLATLPPERGLGLALADRLKRAAGPRDDVPAK